MRDNRKTEAQRITPPSVAMARNEMSLDDAGAFMDDEYSGGPPDTDTF
jgi:hypothetical protein